MTRPNQIHSAGRRRPLLWIATALASLLVLTGCWDMLPIEDLAFANLIYLDRHDGQVQARIEITDPSSLPNPGGGNPSSSGEGGGGGGQAGQPAYEIDGSGVNVAQALRSADLDSVNRLYTGHLQVLLIGAGEAKDDLPEALDYFDRDAKSRVIQWVYLVEKPDTEPIFQELDVPAGEYPANAISNFSLHMESSSNVRPVRLYQLAAILPDPERDATVPILTLTRPAKVFTIKGVALYRKTKWVGTLTVPQAAGIVWIRHQIRFQDFAIPCPMDPTHRSANITLQALGDAVKVQPIFTLRPDGQRVLTSLHVHLFAMARVSESPFTCRVDYGIPKQREAVTEAAAQTIVNLVSESVARAKAVGSDPFGFGTAVRIADPALWTQIAPVWDDKVFPALPVTIRVRIRLADTGGLYRPL